MKKRTYGLLQQGRIAANHYVITCTGGEPQYFGKCDLGTEKRFSDGKVSSPYKHFLGYERGENKGDPPVVNEEQAKLVRRIYHLFMSGKTTGGIARILTEENIPTPVWKASMAADNH